MVTVGEVTFGAHPGKKMSGGYMTIVFIRRDDGLKLVLSNLSLEEYTYLCQPKRGWLIVC